MYVYLVLILGYAFLFLHKNTLCKYSLELSCWDNSNKHHNMFYEDLENIILELSNTSHWQVIWHTS